MSDQQVALLQRIRLALSAFVILLVLSGLTAFPLLRELNLLSHLVQATNWVPENLRVWILTVQQALSETYAHYPFIAYGTDWLAFGHLAIALFFIGSFRDPIRNIWVIQAGLIACALVIPTAFVCGTVRQIPYFWIAIDCSFGAFGFCLLFYILKLVRRLEAEMGLRIDPA